MFIKVEYFLEGDYMNKKFIPGMVMLDGSINPGRSGDFNIGGEDPAPEEVFYQDPTTGEIFFFEDGFWIGTEGNVFNTIQSTWVPML